MRLVIIFLIAFLLLASPNLAQVTIKADDVFTKLISNTADIDKGEAIYELCLPPLTGTMKANIIDYSFFLANGSTNIKGIDKFIWVEDYPYEVPKYSEVYIKKTCSYTDNNLSSERNITYDCSYTERVKDGTETLYKDAWIDASKINIENQKCYKIKMVAYWDVKLGDNAKEWIPHIQINDKLITQDKWSWFNSSWLTCRNWTVEEQDGETRSMMPIIYNATGLDGKQVDSDDFRIVNSGCDNGGYALAYEILGNTSSSVYFVTLVNLTKNANNTFSFYYNNNIANSVEDTDLFIYANNGTVDDWSDNGATHKIDEGAINISIGAVHNKYSYWTLPENITTGKLYFSIMSKVFVGAGEHNIGHGQDTTGGYNDYTTKLLATNGIWKAHETGGETTLTALKDGQWYVLQFNTTFPPGVTEGTNISINGTGYGDFGFFPTYLDTAVIRISGHLGTFSSNKNIFMSRNAFTGYLNPVLMTTGDVETPPEVMISISFISPTPPDGDSVGFDYAFLVNLSIINNTPVSISLDVNGVNTTITPLSTFYVFNPPISGGTVYTYIGWLNGSTAYNHTEPRTLVVSTYTSEELASRFGSDDLGLILLFVLLVVLVYAVSKV